MTKTDFRGRRRQGLLSTVSRNANKDGPLPAAIIRKPARTWMMNTRALLLLAVAMTATAPAWVSTQEPGYPITLIAPGTGPFTFPDGYQIPWDKIEIRVTEKMSP